MDETVTLTWFKTPVVLERRDPIYTFEDGRLVHVAVGFTAAEWAALNDETLQPWPEGSTGPASRGGY